jgi:hypothetical protein
MNADIAVVANKVAEAMPEADVTNLIATGKDLGELKKSALAVSKEVSEGPKGFLTYYNKAVESKNPKDIEANVTKLEGFMQKQQEKLRAFYSEEAKVLSEYQSEAEIKGITLEELYERVKNKNTKAHYTYGDWRSGRVEAWSWHSRSRAGPHPGHYVRRQSQGYAPG